MRLLIGLVSGVIFLAGGLWLAGQPDAAWWMGMAGTVVAFYIVIVYVVAVDSPRRWPGTTWSVRLGRLMFFDRGPDPATTYAARRPPLT